MPSPSSCIRIITFRLSGQQVRHSWLWAYRNPLVRIFVTALRICVSSHLTMTGSSGKSGAMVMPLAAAAGSTARMLS